MEVLKKLQVKPGIVAYIFNTNTKESRGLNLSAFKASCELSIGTIYIGKPEIHMKSCPKENKTTQNTKGNQPTPLLKTKT